MSTLEIHVDQVAKDQRVVLHDDLLATGGSAACAKKLVEFYLRLIEQCGGKVVGFSFIVELEALKGKSVLGDQVHSIVKYDH